MSIILIVFALIYSLCLILLRPAPDSLRDAQATIGGNVRRIKGSLALGIALVAIFYLPTETFGSRLDPQIALKYALSNGKNTLLDWVRQTLSHSFLHFDIQHLLSNVVGIGLASFYERRVGTGRFFLVYVIGCVFASLSILFYSDLTISAVASGGLFALAAAYFVDLGKLTVKQLALAIAYCVFVLLMFSLYGAIETRSADTSLPTIDYAAHALGTISAMVFVRLRPWRGARVSQLPSGS